MRYERINSCMKTQLFSIVSTLSFQDFLETLTCGRHNTYSSGEVTIRANPLQLKRHVQSDLLQKPRPRGKMYIPRINYKFKKVFKSVREFIIDLI